MLTTFEEFKSYFEQLATEHVAINSFVYGGSSRIAQRRNTTIEYPILWLTTPTIAKKPDGRQQFDTLLLILTGSRQDDDEEDAKSEAMRVIACDLEKRIRHDAIQGLFDYGSSDTVLDPKFRAGADNDLGWALDFDLYLGDTGCYDPTKFGQ